jgi:DNA-binding transcriptional LysR family regulator
MAWNAWSRAFLEAAKGEGSRRLRLSLQNLPAPPTYQPQAALTRSRLSPINDYAAASPLPSRFLVADDVAAGRLLHLLAPIAGPPTPMSLVYPSARFLNARVRAFGDLLRERFAGV